MIKTIKIYDDKSVYPSDLIIGNEGEKGVNTLNFDIETNIPSMKWYLIFDNKAYPINNNKLVVMLLVAMLDQVKKSMKEHYILEQIKLL